MKKIFTLFLLFLVLVFSNYLMPRPPRNRPSSQRNYKKYRRDRRSRSRVVVVDSGEDESGREQNSGDGSGTDPSGEESVSEDKSDQEEESGAEEQEQDIFAGIRIENKNEMIEDNIWFEDKDGNSVEVKNKNDLLKVKKVSLYTSDFLSGNTIWDEDSLIAIFDILAKCKNLKSLYIRNKGMSVVSIPSDMSKINSIRSLKIKGHVFFPKPITGLENLEKLEVEKSLPNGIENLKSLKKLSVYKVFIAASVINHISNLKKLEFLYLFKCKIDYGAASTLDKLQSLKNLILSSCKVDDAQELVNNVVKLKNLEKLTLESMDIKVIPQDIKNLDKLKEINIDSGKLNFVTVIPKWLKEKIDNDEIEFSGDYITENQKATIFDKFGYTEEQILNWPTSTINLSEPGDEGYGNWTSDELTELLKVFAKLKNIKKIEFEDINADVFFPDDGLNSVEELEIINTSVLKVGNSKNIKRIEADKISELPRDIGNLKNLNNINIRHAKNLKFLPDSIGDAENLEKICIDTNASESVKTKLKTLPKSFANLKRLKELEFYGINLESLPENIGELEDLEKLVIHVSKLKRLPESFANLKKLKYLNIFGSNMTEIPKVIFKLENLEKFFWVENKTKQVSEEIANLTNLKVLDLRRNNLSSLPKSIEKLNLENLLLEGNDKLME